MDKLQERFNKLLNETTTEFHRYMYTRINWENRMIGLIGPRGVVKNVRETFFFNQMRVCHDVITSSISDFQIENLTFEVGDKNKKQKQLQGIENGFVVKDDIESGYANIIPLWQLGLEY